MSNEVARASAVDLTLVRQPPRKCACNCGGDLPPSARGNRQYIGDHRKRRYRGDQKAALKAQNLPTSLDGIASLARDGRITVPGTGARPRTPRKREVSKGVTAVFQPGRAEEALAHLPDVPELAELRAILSAAIERRDRRLEKAAGPRTRRSS